MDTPATLILKQSQAMEQNRCIIECDFLINILIIPRSQTNCCCPQHANLPRSFKCLPRHGGIKLLWRLLESSWHDANVYISRWHHMMAHSGRKGDKKYNSYILLFRMCMKRCFLMSGSRKKRAKKRMILKHGEMRFYTTFLRPSEHKVANKHSYSPFKTAFFITSFWFML